MRKVEQIEQQIRELTAGEFSELRDWVLEQDWKAWDTQIGADARSGKLDKLIAEAQSNYAAGEHGRFEAPRVGQILDALWVATR
jgi:hypothetical protein